MRSDRLRNVDESTGAVSAAELPRLTSRPPGRRVRRAAAAGTPNSGSRTRSTGPSHASRSRVGQRLDVVAARPATPPRPHRAPRARSRAGADRAAATTRPAPAVRASCTAAWPTTPPAPSTSTRSPAASSPTRSSPSRRRRPRVPAHRPAPGRPRRAAAPHRRRRPTRSPACCRRPAACRPRWRTRPAIPPRRRRRTSTVPTPCTPGTYGVAGTPKYEVPVAHSRSSGVIGAASTRMSTSPVPRRGTDRCSTRGTEPAACQHRGRHRRCRSLFGRQLLLERVLSGRVRHL